MNDPNRVYSGFTSLEAGMNGGISPSLIPRNQFSLGSNVTVRGAFVKTRPPIANLVFSFDSDAVESRFTGVFQGAEFYEAEFGDSGIICSIGGKLFRIQLGATNSVADITPALPIVTTAVFTVPPINTTVLVGVVSETPLAVGDTIYMDSGQYQIVNRTLQQIEVEYLGGAANATVEAGSSVLDSSQLEIIEYQTNPDFYDFVHLFQAENYMIALAGQHSPIIYDGTSARKAQIGEIPPGFLGIYVWGRIWVTLPDRSSFVAGDIVYGPSGTAENGFRDAVLSFTENDFLNEGGAFGVPKNAGPICAMNALETQDTSLGVGNLLVGTTGSVFSVNTPVDRTTWKNLQYPIQTVSLLNYGPAGPRSTVSVNSDLWYRAEDGERSFLVTRRNITDPGNTPQSREIAPILDLDTDGLLFYGSKVLFDNKLFSTVSPVRSEYGVSHRGMSVINFDAVSNMRQKTPPCWEGVFSGVEVFQVLKGRIAEKERAFAFVLNDGNIELWELLRDGAGYYDAFTTVSGNQRTITRTAIQSSIETKSDDSDAPTELKGLYMAELYVDQIVDSVSITIKWRPDQYPSWITWATVNLCANVSQCTLSTPGEFSCSVWKTRQKQYAARVRIPRPPETCNSIAGIPVDKGYEFQYRIEWTGHCRIRKFRAHAKIRSQESEGACPTEQSCSTFEACEEELFSYDSHGV